MQVIYENHMDDSNSLKSRQPLQDRW